jgi:hypothetical protein
VSLAPAIVALAGLSLPGPVALAASWHVSTHHADDHHHEEGARAPDVGAVWHGHSHAPGTPNHEHPYFMSGTHPFRSSGARATPLVPQVPVAWARAVDAVEAFAVQRPQPAPSVVGVGPPYLERNPILRI